MAHIYQVGDDAHKKNEAVCTTTFVQMYDAVLYNSDLSTTADPQAYHDYGLARSANNSGNSMEALALKLLDTQQFPLLYYTAFIAVNYTYHGNSACIHCHQV